MKKPLECYVPRWTIERLSKRSCNCGYKFGKSDIVQIGIRKAKDKKEDVESNVLAVEVYCPICNKGTLITFSNQYKDLRQLLCALMKEIQKNDKLEKSIEISRKEHNSSSGISEKEILDFKKRIKNIEYYDDILKELGIEGDSDEGD
jgi:uncharacterized protein (DUF3084 family)